MLNITTSSTNSINDNDDNKNHEITIILDMQIMHFSFPNTF